MTPEQEIASRAIAKKILTERRSKTNNLTYRQILDKHSPDAYPFVPAKYRKQVWMWLACWVRRVADGK
jgi:hypothetical protein